ncbi:hypothetical protein Pyn_18915 [Prunus yedoensis var. nudiflora]|uniref:Uncharacterized protein n=1 Tax=Prunus yedoensis var. nudiflora TaxID=2094558 RepID=A0A314YW62_PRUYE|nr:hypothetical protein Pyn_18915 [Prunus yedoensis var. nudiflora]
MKRVVNGGAVAAAELVFSGCYEGHGVVGAAAEAGGVVEHEVVGYGLACKLAAFEH